MFISTAANKAEKTYSAEESRIIFKKKSVTKPKKQHMCTKTANNQRHIVVLVSSVGVESHSVREGFRQDWNDRTQGSPQVWGELGHACSFTFRLSTSDKVHDFPARVLRKYAPKSWSFQHNSRPDLISSASSWTLFTIRILPLLNVIYSHLHLIFVELKGLVHRLVHFCYVTVTQNEWKDWENAPLAMSGSLFTELTISRPVRIPPTAVLRLIVLFSISWLWHKSRRRDDTLVFVFQKQKAKDFKSQIIRYLEAMLQSQHRVISQPLTFLINVAHSLVFPIFETVSISSSSFNIH